MPYKYLKGKLCTSQARLSHPADSTERVPKGPLANLGKNSTTVYRFSIGGVCTHKPLTFLFFKTMFKKPLSNRGNTLAKVKDLNFNFRYTN